MPSAEQYALASTLAVVAGASSASTNTWSSPISPAPADGATATTAGPPVENPAGRGISTGTPASDCCPSRSTNAQSRPPGSVCAKS
jgi:hypothetical protein